MLPLYLPDPRRSAAQAAHQARQVRANGSPHAHDRKGSAMFRKYGKSIVAAVIAAVVIVLSAMSQGHINPAERITIIISVVTAVTVLLAPVTHDYPWIKTALGAVLAVANLLVSLVTDGISPADWAALILAAATALGIGLAPAVSDTRPPTPAEP